MYLKIKLFPIWKLDVVEKWLEHQGKLGFQLIKVKFGILFYFKYATPKEVKYFITINKIRGITMDNFNYSLLTEYNATEIPSFYSIFGLYKIKAIKKQDYEFFYDSRKSFIISYIKEYLFCCILLFVLSLILNYFTTNMGTITLSISFLLLSIYYLIGLILIKYR